MNLPTKCFYQILVLAAICVSFSVNAQDEFDRQVVCFQQNKVDSIFRLIKNKKDVSSCFPKSITDGDQYFDLKIGLVRKGLKKDKHVRVDRTIEAWSGMLPMYSESYYFDMKDDSVVVVILGFTAVSKFPKWKEVLNFTVKHWTKEYVKKYKADEGIPASDEEWIKNATVEYFKIEKDICK